MYLLNVSCSGCLIGGGNVKGNKGFSLSSLGKVSQNAECHDSTIRDKSLRSLHGVSGS
jgi:hypothetical protein